MGGGGRCGRGGKRKQSKTATEAGGSQPISVLLLESPQREHLAPLSMSSYTEDTRIHTHSNTHTHTHICQVKQSLSRAFLHPGLLRCNILLAQYSSVSEQLTPERKY